MRFLAVVVCCFAATCSQAGNCGCRARELRISKVPQNRSPNSIRPTATIERTNRIRNQTLVARRSEEHTSELQSLMRISYAVFCLKKKKTKYTTKKYSTTDNKLYTYNVIYKTETHRITINNIHSQQ